MKKIEIELKGCGHPKIYELLQEIGELHDRKNTDYATSEDPLSNFHRVAEWGKKYNLITEGNESTKVAVLYMLKQLDAVCKMLGADQKGTAESRRDKFRDIAVYSLIALILDEEYNG